MTEIIRVKYDLPYAAGDTTRYLNQTAAPFEWEGTFALPRVGFHLLAVTEAAVLATTNAGSPQVRGLPLLGGETDGEFTVRWIFPGATDTSEVIGSFWATFYRD